MGVLVVAFIETIAFSLAFVADETRLTFALEWTLDGVDVFACVVLFC